MAQQVSDSLDSSLSFNTHDHHPRSDAQPEPQPHADAPASSSSSLDPSLSRNLSSSRLNAEAPEFVPRTNSSSSLSVQSSSTQPPPVIRTDPTKSRLVLPQQAPPGLVQVYSAPNSAFHVPVPVPGSVQNHHPYAHHVSVQYHHQPHYHHHLHHHNLRQYYSGGGSAGLVDHQEGSGSHASQSAAAVDSDHVATPLKNGLSEEAIQKILNQVEYYFSDLNLATTDHLIRFINKDPEGYVPISVVASFKKIKALVSCNSQLANILQNSAKLVVSEDGKKIRRQYPLTESDMEELQSRIVVAENLPEDHCYQNLMKLFAVVGSVKNIRTCQPQTSNSGVSLACRTGKADGMLFSNKLHAFVEYETVDLAEKAVMELNVEDNWRNGLRVRLLRRPLKSVQARVKKVGLEGEIDCKENDTSTSQQQHPSEKHSEDQSQLSDAQSQDHEGEEHANDKEGGQKKGRNRGRGKGRGRPQYHHNLRGSHVATSSSNNPVNTEAASAAKQPPGPRMPDGTRGFSMGRGKPVAINIV